MTRESEIMRLLVRISAMLADVASGAPCAVRALSLKYEISLLSEAWQAEEAEYIEAVTNNHCD